MTRQTNTHTRGPMTTALTVHEPQSAPVATMSTAPARGALLRPIAPMKEIVQAKNELDQLITSSLNAGVDYGTVPGSDRQVLLKAGAERVMGWYGCYTRYEIIEREVDHNYEYRWVKRFRLKYDDRKTGKRKGDWSQTEGDAIGLYRYVFRAVIVHRATGEIVGEGVGSCSTLESKYVDRPRDLENTIVKMAQKRAMVAATLNAFALSDRFTQDLEDTASDDDEHEEAVETQPAATAPKREQPREREQPRDEERPEDVDERGVAVIPFGAETIKGKPIDTYDVISIELLVSTVEWLDKNEKARERMPNLVKQIEPHIVERIAKGFFQDADITKTLKYIVKSEARKQRYAFLIDALEERRHVEDEEKLKAQRAEAAAEIKERAAS